MNRVTLGPKMLKEMEQKIEKIRYNLKISLDRKKSYANLKTLHKEFKVRDHVYLRVRLRKSSLKLGSCAKEEPKYCGLFEVFDGIRPVLT